MSSIIGASHVHLKQMARYVDVNCPTLSKEGKRGSLTSNKAPSITGHTFLDRSSHDSQNGKENYLPGQDNLAYLGQAEENDCSYYHPGPQYLKVYQCHNNVPMGAHDFSSSGEAHCHPQADLIARNAQEDAVFSHHPDSTTNHGIWHAEEIADVMSYFEDANDSPSSEQIWQLPDRRVPLPRGDYIEELEPPHQPHLITDGGSVRLRTASPTLYRESAEDDICSNSHHSNLSVHSQEAMTPYVGLYPSMEKPGGPFLELSGGRPQNGTSGQDSLVTQNMANSGPESQNTRLVATSLELSVQAAESWLSNDTDDIDDLEVEQTRKHPLYTDAEPDQHGMYHCPFRAKTNCEHVATKLKCNYDKFIDSHLKPHRCKAPECQNLRFSSTACRLRHEREAHGSHGHGVKPYQCKFDDCERSRPGNGFPRAWNCNDHMRRVHGHAGPLDTESNASQTSLHDDPPWTGRSTARSLVVARKRAVDASVESDLGKRPKLSMQHGRSNATTTQHGSKRSASKLARLEVDWRDQFSNVHQRIHGLRGPLDMEAIEALHETKERRSASPPLKEFPQFQIEKRSAKGFGLSGGFLFNPENLRRGSRRIPGSRRSLCRRLRNTKPTSSTPLLC